MVERGLTASRIALRCRVSRAAAGSYWTFSSALHWSRERRTRDCKAPPQLPDSPGLWVLAISGISRCAEGGGKSNLKILICLMGINTAPEGFTAVIRASEGFLDLKNTAGEWSELK